MKVDVMIAGAQKCATTTLFRILTSHPRIVGSTPKEPHFFSTTDDWTTRIEEYHALFERRDDAVYLEGSTSYTFYPHRRLEIWNDLHEYNPDLRFIYLVRHPVDRIVSSYMHNYLRGYTQGTFEQTVLRNPLALDVTRYHAQIAPFVERFGRDQVLLLDFDDLIHDRTATVEAVAGFVGVDPAGIPATVDSIHANRSGGSPGHHHRFNRPPTWLRAVRRASPRLYEVHRQRRSPGPIAKPSVPPPLRRAVLHMLMPDIERLEHLMDRDLSKWFAADDPPMAGRRS